MGELLTVSENGQEFPHRHGETYLIQNRYTDTKRIVLLYEHSMVGKLLTVSENGQEFPHRHGETCKWSEMEMHCAKLPRRETYLLMLMPTKTELGH